jgi:Tfp pilus assembly protein PilF
MNRFPLFLSLIFGVLIIAGADGCSSDPNVEGAKLDLRNQDYDRALSNLETALENNPQNAEAYELKGRVLSEKAFATQDQDVHIETILDMLDAYDNAVEYDPTYQETVTNALRFAFANEFQRGIQAFNRGRNDDSQFLVAARYFNTAGVIQPDSSGAYVNEAYAYMNGGQPESAIVPFERALETGDTEPETFRFLAQLYQTNDRADEAVGLLEDASAMYPENVDIQTELLNAYQITGQVDKALENYSSAVERDPGNALFRYNYGSLLIQVGRYDEAIAQLESAVEIDPEYSSAYYNIGAAHINQAVDVNSEISDMDDNLRENRDDMSNEEVEAAEAAIDAKVEERRMHFQAAVAPLEQAKALFEAGGEDVGDVCRALYQSYAQTNQTDKAQSVAACAGYSDN